MNVTVMSLSLLPGDQVGAGARCTTSTTRPGGTRNHHGGICLGGPLSVAAEGGPGRGPRGLQSGGQVDRHSLFVVVDAEAVPERGDLADVGELATEQFRVEVHRDGRGVGGGRRAPPPEVVGAAVGLRQTVPGAVAFDRPRLAVVPG